MKILVGCESSGIVRDAFNDRGHLAYSVDITGTEQRGRHIQADLRDIISDKWDMMIAFPPCTYLTRAGNRAMKEDPSRAQYRDEALHFIALLMDAPISKICIENPPGIISTYLGHPKQIIHPWQFGHPISKPTCLWLKNLKPLKPTEIMNQRIPWDWLAHNPRDRSRTFPGIARAMAEQWGE